MGLLFTVLTLGVIRLRAAHKRALREEAEVEMVKQAVIFKSDSDLLVSGMGRCGIEHNSEPIRGNFLFPAVNFYPGSSLNSRANTLVCKLLYSKPIEQCSIDE